MRAPKREFGNESKLTLPPTLGVDCHFVSQLATKPFGALTI
jgi:hypothetical protein